MSFYSPAAVWEAASLADRDPSLAAGTLSASCLAWYASILWLVSAFYILSPLNSQRLEPETPRPQPASAQNKSCALWISIWRATFWSQASRIARRTFRIPSRPRPSVSVEDEVRIRAFESYGPGRGPQKTGIPGSMHNSIHVCVCVVYMSVIVVQIRMVLECRM